MSLETIRVREPINLKVVRFELDFTTLVPTTPRKEKKPKKIKVPKEIRINNKNQSYIPPPIPPLPGDSKQKKDVKELVEELLDEIYSDHRDWSSNNGLDFSRGSTSGASIASSQFNYGEQTDAIERVYLEDLDLDELRGLLREGEERLRVTGQSLARCVRVKDRLRREQKRLCAAFTVLLRHISKLYRFLDELQSLLREGEERLRVTGQRLARCVRVKDRLRREHKRLCAAFTVLLRHISKLYRFLDELQSLLREGEERLRVTGQRLARCVRVKDRLRREHKRLCAAFTVLLRHISKLYRFLDELQSLLREGEERLRVTGQRLARCVRVKDRLRREHKRLCAAAFTVLQRQISKRFLGELRGLLREGEERLRVTGQHLGRCLRVKDQLRRKYCT